MYHVSVQSALHYYYYVWVPLQEGSNILQMYREFEYGVLTYVCKTWAV